MTKGWFKTYMLLLMATSSFWLGAKNLSKLKDLRIDDLTDQQIQRFAEKAETEGYPEEQFIFLARTHSGDKVISSKLLQRMKFMKSSHPSDPAIATIFSTLRNDLTTEDTIENLFDELVVVRSKFDRRKLIVQEVLSNSTGITLVLLIKRLAN